MRIIAFVGSPVEDNEKDVSLRQIYNDSKLQRKHCFSTETLLKTTSSVTVCLCIFFTFSPLCPNPLFLQLVKLAKRLKKEKVNVDIINFGEEVGYQAYFPSYWYKAL